VENVWASDAVMSAAESMMVPSRSKSTADQVRVSVLGEVTVTS